MATILETYEAKHQQSRKLAERGRELFPTGVTHDTRAFWPWPVYVDRAQGSRKWDVDGNEYVDFIGGHGALLLGHGRPEVVEAAKRALDHGTHYGSSHEAELEWADQVCAMVPCAERVRFTSSGTEATMMALRLARASTGREKVVKLAEHFHGWHDIVVGSLREDDPHPHSVGVPDGFYDSLSIVPPGDERALAEALASREVAAVILEPTGAHYGTHPLSPDYLHATRRLTAESGTVFIMDEVITGFRMAPGGAQERYGVTPDLSTHAKILAGGLPGGCVAGREEIVGLLELREDDDDWNSRRRIAHQGTFNANPVSAAAGVACLRLIVKGGEVERADASTARLVRGLNGLFDELSIPGSAWAVSSMWHLNLGEDQPRPSDVEWDVDQAPAGVAGRLQQPLRWALYNHGVDLMGMGGMVSSAHASEDIERTVEAFRSAVGDLRSEGLLA